MSADTVANDGQGRAENGAGAASGEDAAPGPRVALAKWLYWSRRQRPDAEDPRLFGEPGWDMLLDLYIHQASGSATSITAACIGAHAPATTALRYIELLCELGWIEKVRDDQDKRRSFLALTTTGLARLERYLDEALDQLGKSGLR